MGRAARRDVYALGRPLPVGAATSRDDGGAAAAGCGDFLQGKKATLVNLGGESSRRYKVVEEKGNHEENPEIDKRRGAKYIQLPSDKELAPMAINDMSVEHMANWFECMRTRQQPVATEHDGFGHSVTCIKAAESYWTGKKLYRDPPKEEVLDHAPQAM